MPTMVGWKDSFGTRDHYVYGYFWSLSEIRIHESQMLARSFGISVRMASCIC